MYRHDEVENHIAVGATEDYELSDPLTPRRSRLAFELHNGIAEPVIEFEDCAFFRDQAS